MSDNPENERKVLEPDQIEKPASLGDAASPDEAKRKTNQTVVIILAVVALCLIVCCVGTLIITSISRSVIGSGTFETLRTESTSGNYTAIDTLEQSFDVDGSANIVITNEVGDTTIRVGNNDEVYVSATIKATGTNANEWLEQIEVSVEEDNDTLYITGQVPSEWLASNSGSINLEITVPANSDIKITTDVGSTSISDIEGKIIVNTSVGDIKIDSLKGELQAYSGVGDVVVNSWTMTNDASVETGVGDIEVELDRSLSFEIDAETGIGDIDCEFNVDGETDTSMGPNDSLSGAVGDEPVGKLILRTGTGSITILQD